MLHEVLDQKIFFQLPARDAQIRSGEATRDLISDRHICADRIERSDAQWKLFKYGADWSEQSGRCAERHKIGRAKAQRHRVECGINNLSRTIDNEDQVRACLSTGQYTKLNQLDRGLELAGTISQQTRGFVTHKCITETIPAQD